MIRRFRAGPDPEASLERRYRRLLAWYPAAYRAANAEEMLGVALASAAPGQRRPSLGESVNLVLSGTRERLRCLLGGLGSDAWQRAAAMFAVIGPVLMATIYAESLAGVVASGLTGFPERLSVSAVALAAGWSVVAAAALLRWRWAAALGASLGAAGEAVHLAVLYPANPSYLVVSWWQLMLATVTALAAVSVATQPTIGRPPLGQPPLGQPPRDWRALVAILVAAAALAAFPLAEAASSTVTRYPGGAATVSSPLFGLGGLLRIGLFALLAVAVLVAVIRSEPAARRRVIVLAAPVAAVAVLVEWTLGGFLASSPRFAHPVLLTAPQWAALVLVPLAALAAGLILVGRYERMLHQVWQDGAASGPPS